MTSENNKMDIESSIPPEMNIYIDNILGIKSTNQNNKNYFSSYLNLINILKELKFKEKNNKKSEKDIKQETIEQIENLSKNSAKQIKSEKEKIFNSFTYSSTKNKTKYFHTAEQDEISPTLYAFYFCEKSKQILTDHQAAALKDANIDTDYLKNSKDLNSEDFLDTSTNNNNNNNNNGNLNGNNNNSKDKNFSTPLLNKKRKGSISNKTNNKNSNKKVKKNEKNIKENNNKEKNISEEENNNNEENNNKNNNNNNNNEEYCLPTCKLGRKTTYNVMVMCDECKKWFHALCVNLPENKQILESKDWKCPFCNIKNNDKMMLEKPMINNIKYNNNNNNNTVN